MRTDVLCQPNRNIAYSYTYHVVWCLKYRCPVGIHRLVKRLKGRSSRLLRQEFPWLTSRLSSLWTNSYFVATVGGAPLEIIKQYMEQQEGR
jgi:putative transposase